MCESFFYTETCRFICSWHISLISSWHFQSQTVVWKYIVWEWTSSLLGFVNRRINREWQRFSLRNMQRKKGSKRIQMIIKMVNEFKLAVVHFARPNPMQLCACAWIYFWTQKIVENQDWASGPPGHRRPWAHKRRNPVQKISTFFISSNITINNITSELRQKRWLENTASAKRNSIKLT